MRYLFRRLGLAGFSRDELDLLVDVSKGVLTSFNWRQEHAEHLYLRLRHERLIFLEQFKGTNGQEVEAHFAGYAIPLGTWRISPAAPASVFSAIKQHAKMLEISGLRRVSHYERTARARIAARQGKRVSEEKRLAILWHISHGMATSLTIPETHRRTIVLPASIEQAPFDAAMHGNDVSLTDTDIAIVLDELMDAFDLTVLQEYARRWDIKRGCTDRWEVRAWATSTKVRACVDLGAADRFRTDPQAARQQRVRDASGSCASAS